MEEWGWVLSDKEVILRYFAENDMEEEGIEIISGLSKLKIDKLKRQNEVIRGSLNCYIPFTSSVSGGNYSDEFVTAINRCTVRMMGGLDLLDEDLDLIAVQAPVYKEPKVIWRDLYEFLMNKGIYFKDSKREK